MKTPPPDLEGAPKSESRPGDLLHALGELPPVPQDPEVLQRIHRQARAVFLRAARPSLGWVGRLDRLYFSAEPGLALSIAVAYLGWALAMVAELHR